MVEAQMTNLPYGMTDEIEIAVTITGPATAILADLRRMRESGVERIARINVLVNSPGSRWREQMTMPAVATGDASAAFEQLDRLAKQCRIDANLEQRINQAIKELQLHTRAKS